jgi:hypothetical protein
MSLFGLIGTITYDVITRGEKTLHEGLGGILYQAAVLCGWGHRVNLYTNLGLELETEVRELTKEWKSLNREGVSMVPGPGNRVFLDYPRGKERGEVLKSVVPPICPDRILEDLPHFDFIIMVMNSGFDMKLQDWKKVKKKATCPVWLDIHSLFLERKIGSPREYIPVHDWKDWVEGIDYFQANKAEVAALLGHPGKNLELKELESFGEAVFELGMKAVFLTLGEEGVLLMEKSGSSNIPAMGRNAAVDSTGCGDVFCAGAAAFLSEGRDPFDSAANGVRAASKAAGICGVSPLFHLMLPGLHGEIG